MHSALYRISHSFLLRFSAVGFGVAALSLSYVQQAYAAPNNYVWCFAEVRDGQEAVRECSISQESDDAARKDCEEKFMGTFGGRTCTKLDNPNSTTMMGSLAQGVAYCSLRTDGDVSRYVCAREKAACGPECDLMRDGRIAGDNTVEVGKVWCARYEGIGRQVCADTLEECQARAATASICTKKTATKLYCQYKDGDVPYCFETMDDCRSAGVDLGFPRSCVVYDPADGRTISEAVGGYTGGGTTTSSLGGMQFTGRVEYQPLEDVFFAPEHRSLPVLMRYLFSVGIAIVGLAALFMLVIGGATYLLSAGNTATMGSAKKIMIDAVMGLVLALGSWLLLYVINPDLIGIDENIELLTRISPYAKQQVQSGAAAQGGSAAGGGATGSAVGGGSGYDLAEETARRADLSAANIDINKRPCRNAQDSDCTSIAGLPQKSLDSLIGLRGECANCVIVVTGGSEEGHASHGPGKDVFDLRVDGNLRSHFFLNGTQGVLPQFGNTSNATYWDITSGALQGARVVEEQNPPHFHVYWP